MRLFLFQTPGATPGIWANLAAPGSARLGTVPARATGHRDLIRIRINFFLGCTDPGNKKYPYRRHPLKTRIFSEKKVEMQATTAANLMKPSHWHLPKLPPTFPKQYRGTAGRSNGRQIYPKEETRSEARPEEEKEGEGSC